MRLKKTIALLLALVLLLTGCGSGKAANKTRVGVIFANYEKTAQQEALLDSLKQAGFWCAAMDAKGDLSLQKTLLSGILNQDYPLVVLEPVSADAAAELANMAILMEVPAIFIGEEPPAEVLDSWSGLAYVGVDDAQQSNLQGKILLNSPNGGDINGDNMLTYAILRGPADDPQADFLTQNCDTALQQDPGAETLLATCEGDWSRESGQRLAQELLAQYGKDLEAILCNNDEMAIGAAQAVAAGGWTVGTDIAVIGIGGEAEMLRLISEGTCSGTVVPDSSALTEQIARLASGLMENTPAEKRQYAGYLAITGENISVYYE